MNYLLRPSFLPKIALGIAALAWASGSFGQFTASDVFPNYYHEKGQEPVSQELVDQAFTSIADRLEIPKSAAEGYSSDSVPLSQVFHAAQAKDPSTQIHLGGSTAKEIMGYLYETLYERKRQDQRLSTEEVLKTIAHDQKKLSTVEVLGPGHPMEILVTGPQKATVLQAVHDSLGLHTPNSFAPQVRVLEKSEHEQELVHQGSTGLDHISLNLDHNSPQRISDPRNAISLMLKGKYEFNPPEPNPIPQDPLAPLARGIQPMVGIPFLHPTADSEAKLKDMTNELIQHTPHVGESGSQDFRKILGTYRVGGGHNRIHFSNESLETSLRTLSNKIGKESKRALIPELVDREDSPTHSQPKKPLTPWLASKLMSKEAFKENHTKDGYLFHGTPAFETAFSILKNGLRISSTTDGGDLYGRGAYTTHKWDLAAGYAKDQGVILKLKVRDDVQGKILNLDPVSDEDEGLKNLKAEAAAQGRDLFEYLAREYGIDIVVKEHVIVQNSKLLEMPKNFSEVIKTEIETLKNKISSGELTPKMLQHYKNFYSKSLAAGFTPQPLNKLIREALSKDLSPQSHENFLKSLAHYQEPDAEELLHELTRHEKPEFRKLGAHFLGKSSLSFEAKLNFLKALESNHFDHLDEATSALAPTVLTASEKAATATRAAPRAPARGRRSPASSISAKDQLEPLLASPHPVIQQLGLKAISDRTMKPGQKLEALQMIAQNHPKFLESAFYLAGNPYINFAAPEDLAERLQSPDPLMRRFAAATLEKPEVEDPHKLLSLIPSDDLDAQLAAGRALMKRELNKPVDQRQDLLHSDLSSPVKLGVLAEKLHNGNLVEETVLRNVLHGTSASFLEKAFKTPLFFYQGPNPEDVLKHLVQSHDPMIRKLGVASLIRIWPGGKLTHPEIKNMKNLIEVALASAEKNHDLPMLAQLREAIEQTENEKLLSHEDAYSLDEKTTKATLSNSAQVPSDPLVPAQAPCIQ